ncbi:hypothetical protein [Myxococcus xanthus]|uniref:Cell wall surface anchor family protein n=1 Tax=Myxococcus xanthus TaxID=34 RepID=A0AAE6FX49_MYXXA|nr:hypothetical protein [Myxococcus xanthus]QDE66601.1 hypothetical protein BHS09_06045 [Myxococcus xanthus]QDE73874.1 hypothetical protein BHS08_06050 [Myxococcus xanthus]QDE95467.1 hypothetical protein BHS05_06060 [Myxococcus xanthus]
MAPPIRRNEPRPVPTPPVTARPTPPPPPPPPPARAEARPAQADRFEDAHNRVTQAATGLRSVSDAAVATQVRDAFGPRRFGPVNLPGGNGPVVEGANTRLARGAGAVSLAANVAQLPTGAVETFRDVRDALRNPTEANVREAVGTASGTLSTGLMAARDGLNLAGNVSNYRAATDAARTAFTAAAPEASRAAANRVATTAANTALEGASRQVVRRAAAEVAERGLEGAARTAGTAARAAVQGGGTAVARAAGRFTPGLNVAIAAADTVAAVNTITDPNASAGKKITAGVTALGSIAAATNIPVVSQVGAAVSTVSGFIGSFF